MFHIPIIAQATAGQNGSAAVPETALSSIIENCWTHVTSLSWFQAVIAIAFGAILLFHGWRIYKMLVVISFALLGLFLGMLAGERVGSPLWGAVIGMLVLGFLAIPLMQWAISILGAIAGGILGASFWYAGNLPDKYVLAGALIGIVAGGMISFIVIKAAVILFTSLQGAILVAAGVLALLADWQQTAARTRDVFFEQRWFVPVLLAIITALGVYMQAKFNKGGDIGATK